MTDKNIDFLAIGDTVIDAFIELQDARVTCDIDDENCSISMRWGDKIPYKGVNVIYAVGNSPNAAVSASRLGLSSALMSHVGGDTNGEDCLTALKENGVITDFMTSEDGLKTNYHYVLSYEAERTILIKHEEFAYDLEKQTADKPLPRWVYFSSVGEHGLPYHHAIAQWVKENDIKMAFQPGTFQISLGTTELKDIYESAEIFFCNVEEAQRILDITERDIEKLLKSMQALGPKIVCITDGPKGAYAYDSHTGEGWFHPIYPDIAKPKERTGAGDAFSSTFTAAIASGKTVEEALAWGPINSMNVVQHVGAQAGLLTKEKLEEYLANAPEDYKAKKLF